MTRYVTADDREALASRYRLYRLCECSACGGTGKVPPGHHTVHVRCPECRGEGRVRDLVATATDPESLGVALVTLGREGEWKGCPIGVLDTLGKIGEKWLVKPWTPSARNVSDAGRTLQAARKGK